MIPNLLAVTTGFLLPLLVLISLTFTLVGVPQLKEKGVGKTGCNAGN